MTMSFHSPQEYCLTDHSTADKREFFKISQAVGVGFVVMGAIGYVVKLSRHPLAFMFHCSSKATLLTPFSQYIYR